MAAAVAALTMITGGCAVSSTESPRDEQRAAADRVVADGLSLDLSRPPTRADLALGDGMRSVVLQSEERSDFPVRVTFADGTVLETPAYAAGVSAASSDAAPGELTLRRRGLTTDELRTALGEAVERLGADQAAVRSFLARAEQQDRGDSDLRRFLSTRVPAPQELMVEPIISSEGRASINYLIRWEPAS